MIEKTGAGRRGFLERASALPRRVRARLFDVPEFLLGTGLDGSTTIFSIIGGVHRERREIRDGTVVEETVTRRVGRRSYSWVTRKWTDAGELTDELHYLDSEFSRTDGPAIVRYAPGMADPIEESHWKNDRLHRIDGPAETTRYLGEGERASFHVGGSRVEGPAGIAEELRRWPRAEVVEAIAFSPLAPLLHRKVDLEPILDAIAAGIFTAEGIREVTEGAPVEWVRAFESGDLTAGR